MDNIVLVNPKDLKTLEHYAASLLSSLASLKTLEAFHIAALKQGLLDEDEMETAKTICWEIQRLIALYRTQIQNVLDRTALNEEQVLESLSRLMPKLKIPKKKED